MPTKEISRLEKSALRMSVTVPKDELQTAYGKAINDLNKDIQLPGFRKGKAPRNVLERKWGDALREDILNTIIGGTVKTIIEDEAFPKEYAPLAYSYPVIDGDLPKLDLENDLAFAVKWDIAPQIKTGEWRGSTIEAPDVAVAEEDIARELEVIRERNAVMLDKPAEESSAKGDVVTANFAEIGEDGREMPGTRRDRFAFTLGKNSTPYLFDDEVTGMKVGETKVFTKEYPADYEAPELAGTSKNIAVTVTSIREKNLPDLDDDLAQDVDENFNTLDDLKRHIRERLQYRLDSRLNAWKLTAILEKILETTPVELPESMVALQLETQIREMGLRMGLKEPEIKRFMENTTADMAKTMKEYSVKSLQLSLLQEQLVKDLHIVITDEERNAEIERIAAGNGSGVDTVAEYYKQPGAAYEIDDFLKRDKLREALLKDITITTGAKQTYEDFIGGAYYE